MEILSNSLVLNLIISFFPCVLSLQKLEDEFRRIREEQERFFSEHRVLPKALKASFSLPQISREERAFRTKSTSSMDNMRGSTRSQDQRMSMNPLDEVVLGHPRLEGGLQSNRANGNSS